MCDWASVLRRATSRVLLFSFISGSVPASSFYTFDVVVKAGDLDSAGNTISTIHGESVSINDFGFVAFAATSDAGQSLYMANGFTYPEIISFATPSTSRSRIRLARR